MNKTCVLRTTRIVCCKRKYLSHIIHRPNASQLARKRDTCWQGSSTATSVSVVTAHHLGQSSNQAMSATLSALEIAIKSVGAPGG